MGNIAEKSFFIPPKVVEKGVSLKQEEYQFFANFMHQRCGVHLEANKIPMIQARLSKRLHHLDLPDFKAYINYLKNSEAEAITCINALTTHKTDFFREPEHFDFLKSVVLPDFLQRGALKKGVSIWSAACSSGEEVYTIAMTVLDFLAQHPGARGIPLKILGTDIDTDVIQKAEKGIYPEELLSPLSPAQLQQFFLRGSGSNKGFYRIKPELSAVAKFRRHNLLESFSALGNLSFHVIFLRNVLIYFTEETRRQAIAKMSEALCPGGFLFVGHSESLAGLDHGLTNVAPAVYRKN